MTRAFYACFFVSFVCLLGMSVSAVLVDHGLASRLAYDLFGMVGVVFAVPALVFGWGAQS